MKSTSPVGSALMILGYTFSGFIAVFIVGNIAVSLVFGAEAEMNWPFSFLLVLLSPFVFLGGILAAIAAYKRERDRKSGDTLEASK